MIPVVRGVQLLVLPDSILLAGRLPRSDNHSGVRHHLCWSWGRGRRQRACHVVLELVLEMSLPPFQVGG